VFYAEGLYKTPNSSYSLSIMYSLFLRIRVAQALNLGLDKGYSEFFVNSWVPPDKRRISASNYVTTASHSNSLFAHDPSIRRCTVPASDSVVKCAMNE
jgi:hypothetical protein